MNVEHLTDPSHRSAAAASTTSTSLRGSAAVAVLASAGAALVHAAAAGTHTGSAELPVLFSITALAQLSAAGAMALTRSRRIAGALAAVNLAALLAWATSRTVGLPWPEILRERESIGTQDGVAAALAAVAVVAVGLSAVHLPWRLPRLAAAVASGFVALAVGATAVAGMVADHDHDSAEHDHGTALAAGSSAADPATAAAGGSDDGHDHDHGTAAVASAAPATTGVAAAPSGPIISLDDARLTSAQRSAAEDIIERTKAAMAAFPDEAAVQAAGYLSIGDGRTGFEHYVNYRYLTDEAELDPARIESIVLIVNPDGTKKVASAMYILTPGKTMADVPDIAGELTTWHDHQNLCWEGVRVVGTTNATGSCPRGVFRATPPMLHVWIEPHPCGPFAGIEGSHGQGCAAHNH